MEGCVCAVDKLNLSRKLSVYDRGRKLMFPRSLSACKVEKLRSRAWPPLFVGTMTCWEMLKEVMVSMNSRAGPESSDSAWILKSLSINRLCDLNTHSSIFGGAPFFLGVPGWVLDKRNKLEHRGLRQVVSQRDHHRGEQISVRTQ